MVENNACHAWQASQTLPVPEIGTYWVGITVSINHRSTVTCRPAFPFIIQGARSLAYGKGIVRIEIHVWQVGGNGGKGTAF